MQRYTIKLKTAALTPALFLAVMLLPVVSEGCGSDGSTITAGADDATLSGGDTSTDLASTTGTSTGSGSGPTIESIRDEVSEIRGLPVKSELDVSYINRDELAREMEAEMEEFYPADEIAVEEKVLKGLGLVDEEIDLVDTAQQMLTEGVLGYYDDDAGELKVISETDEIDSLNEVTLAHEITHALQDQNFSLGRLLPDEGSGNDDRDLAVLSLIEGDATATDEDYAATHMGLGDAISLLLTTAGAPIGLGSSYLDDSLSFPYFEGSAFVDYLRKDGGWEAVNTAYARPPESTEQIMHPRKYLEAEAPIVVATPDLTAALGSGWGQAYENVIGEFDILKILEVGLPQGRAASAAQGWDGGSIDLYEDASGRQMLALVLVWDSEREADQFTLAMSDNLEWQTESAFVFQEGRLPFLEAGFESWVMAQRGRSTVIVSATDVETGERAARLILGL